MKKILVIQTASLGDVILATPLLEQLHSSFPTCRMDIMIKKGGESLFLEHPFIGKIWLWDKRKHKYARLFSIIKNIRREKYDIVINLQRFASSGLATVCSGAKYRVGFTKNPLSILFDHRVPHLIEMPKHSRTGTKPLHETERNFQLLKGICPITTDLRPRLYPSTQDDASVSCYKQSPYITISPASLWFTKQYPIEHWKTFLRKLDASQTVYFLGGKADIPLCEQLMHECAHLSSDNLAGKLSLLQSAALMRDAVTNFVNDSAPLHLCSSVNAKVVAIFCSTIPEFGFTPLSTQSIVLETEESLACRPCGLHGHKECPKGHFRCAYSINPERLLNACANS